MALGKARQYYASEETRESLKEIGGGNYSKGIRISAAYHERLVEALKDAMAIIESDANTEENYGPLCRIGGVLAEVEEAGK